jgi:putative endonuclease
MTVKRLQVGAAGEKAAKSYLESKGYSVIETNYRCPLGEIDIVALDCEVTVIVEVRARTGKSFGGPEESINRDKARRLYRLALYYTQSACRKEIPCRIDLVAVNLDRKDLSVRSINHIKGILSG